MHPKITRLVLFIFIGVLLSFLAYKFVIQKKEPVINVDFSTEIKGKVRGFNRARGYKIYLLGMQNAFNFDGFRNYQISRNDALGYYLDYGDSLVKVVNSDTLELFRDGNVTIWKIEE